MSTNALGNPSPYASLYAGKERKPGDLLTQMMRKGRKVSSGERLRWLENRKFYVGDQNVSFSGSINALQRGSSTDPNRDQPNAYNQLRRYTDARTAIMTKERPPYEILPEDNDADSIDAARLAEKFVTAKWGRGGWNIKARLGELCRHGDIDGIAWLYVNWDEYADRRSNDVLAYGPDGKPVTDRATYEALKDEDPNMTTWKMAPPSVPFGDVCWEVVLPGEISVDPFAIKSFDQARWIIRSKILPREEVENRLGKPFRDAVTESRQVGGDPVTTVNYQDLAVDADSGRSTINEAEGVLVHCVWIKPGYDWPKGLYAEIVDRAPNLPMRVEPWEDELPFFCYAPRPDPGHFIRSRGIVDDLKPIQRDWNTTIRYIRTWIKRVATKPVAIPVGSLRSDSIYNDDGWFEYHAAMGEPHDLQVSSEPTAVITNNLAWTMDQMERISGVSAYAQGLVMANGPRSAQGIAGLIQQTENNLADVETAFTEAIEWGVSRSLKLVRDKYDRARMVVGVGIDDAVEFKAFVGAMLRGATRFRINGPLMPKSKEVRIAQISQFAPYLGDKLLPYLGGLIDGDPTELQDAVNRDRQYEKGQIRTLVALVSDPTARQVYENFESDKAAFTQALNLAIQQGSPDPGQTLAQNGVRPPNLTEALQTAGVKVPVPEDFVNAAVSRQVIDDYRKGDAYDALDEMAKQLLRERAQVLIGLVGQQVAGLAQQQPMGQQPGSAPNPKGTPSPPKQVPGRTM